MKKIEISDLVKVESSNINMVGYNEDTTYVQFKNGSVYSYPKTTREEFEKLAGAQSVGSYFAKSYRNKEDYSKLEDTVLVKDTKVQDAVKVLTEALVRDPGYRISWQANIAMAFLDEYELETVPEGESLTDDARTAMHKIANQAADNFLNLLCRDVESKR